MKNRAALPKRVRCLSAFKLQHNTPRNTIQRHGTQYNDTTQHKTTENNTIQQGTTQLTCNTTENRTAQHYKDKLGQTKLNLLVVNV